MAELKTKETDADVMAFLNRISDERRRQDCIALADLMTKTLRAAPKMWGDSIVGFGNYRYKSEKTGREGDWFLAGFSPRKQALTLYLMGGFKEEPDLLQDLGTFKTGGGCLYIKSLADIDLKVLKKLIKATTARLRK